MAASLNRVMLIGNLTRDPELRKTNSGQSVTSFSLATNREYTSSDGQKKSIADYHNVVAWGRLAEICSQYLHKGKKIYVDGHLQTREWEGQDGQKRYRTEIVVENMIMLGDKRDSGSAPTAQEAAPVATDAAQPDEIRLEDIPF